MRTANVSESARYGSTLSQTTVCKVAHSARQPSTISLGVIAIRGFRNGGGMLTAWFSARLTSSQPLISSREGGLPLPRLAQVIAQDRPIVEGRVAKPASDGQRHCHRGPIERGLPLRRVVRRCRRGHDNNCSRSNDQDAADAYRRPAGSDLRALALIVPPADCLSLCTLPPILLPATPFAMRFGWIESRAAGRLTRMERV